MQVNSAPVEVALSQQLTFRSADASFCDARNRLSATVRVPSLVRYTSESAV
jgi:hypothetical protein